MSVLLFNGGQINKLVTNPYPYPCTEDQVFRASESDDDHDTLVDENHPDIADRLLYCRVEACEEIKKLKEPSLQGNQRVCVLEKDILCEMPWHACCAHCSSYFYMTFNRSKFAMSTSSR